MQRLRHLERLDVAAAIDEHAHRLDRVERDTLGPLPDPGAQLLGKVGHEPLEQLVDRLVGERLERDRGEVPLRRAPARVPFGELRPREREDEQRVVPRPVEQVVDEVQQRRVRPLEIFEDEHRRALLREPLEEEAPGRKEVVTVGGAALFEPEQLREPRLDPGALLGVGEVLLERFPELAGRRLWMFLLGDPGPHAHHLGERPVRDAVAVGETAAAMPVDVAHQPVDVALELRREPRLADPGDADDRDEPSPALLARGVEEIFDQPQLPLASHERRLETGRAAFAAA